MTDPLGNSEFCFLKMHYPSELGQTFVVCLVMPLQYKDLRLVSRCIILSLVVHLSRPILKDTSWSRGITCYLHTLETHNQTNYKCVPKFVQPANADLFLAVACLRRKICLSSSRRIKLLYIKMVRTQYPSEWIMHPLEYQQPMFPLILTQET